MRFSSPLLLTLLLLLPLFAWLGWPSRGASRRRELLSLALRLLMVVCLVLALAGMELVRAGSDLAVVFLLDVSDSMSPEAVTFETDILRSSIEHIGPDDRFAVILFGGDALVERPMLPGSELQPLSSIPVTTQTDLAGAIRLGMSLFPSGYAHRMVILSDGMQTTGDALKAAHLAADAGVQILSYPFVTEPEPDALVDSLDIPTHLRPNEQFDLNVTLQSNHAGPSTIRVYAGDQVVYDQVHELRKGLQTFSLPLQAGAPGFVRYRVDITPEQDRFQQNNRMDAFSQVQGPPRILVVAPAPGEILPGRGTRPDEASALLQVLEVGGFVVQQVAPSRLTSDLPTLAQYNSIMLVDVPATDLSLQQMQALKTYVHDLGGGLVAVGGPTSYGVGGYYRTPLEEALPVDMEIKDEQRRPSLEIIYIIDHSGSMSETSGGVEKLELAKEAVARSVELLFPTDRVGVIAFDDLATWVFKPTEIDDPGAVARAVGTIRTGGGTDILAGVQAMAQVLPGEPAKVKHVILLTDGGADPAGIPELVEKLHAENGITLSTIAIGRDAAPFLDDLAVAGGGRYHFTVDASSIPTIFTEEITLASRAYIVEEKTAPILSSPSPILQNIDSTPPLYGYVASSGKQLARVILKSRKDDPILASWQYGLGHAVAFTSDATGRWGRDWVRWPGFPTFWLQVVRYSLGQAEEVSLEMKMAAQGGNERITLDAFDRTGGFLNGYEVQAEILSPDGGSQTVSLHQAAPGRYQAEFTPGGQGIYLVHFTGRSVDGGGFSQTLGWNMSYSPEFRQRPADVSLLSNLALITGGKVAASDPGELFAHDLSASRAARPIWPWLLGLAAILLPIDVASRRLILTRQDFVRLYQFLAEWISLRRTGRTARSQPSPQMQALFQAKERARKEPSAPAQPQEDRVAPLKPVETPLSPEPKPAAQPPVSTTKALLARKNKMK